MHRTSAPMHFVAFHQRRALRLRKILPVFRIIDGTLGIWTCKALHRLHALPQRDEDVLRLLSNLARQHEHILEAFGFPILLQTRLLQIVEVSLALTRKRAPLPDSCDHSALPRYLLPPWGSDFTTACAGLMSNSGCGAPIIHLSNQSTMYSSRSMRCQGSPERESSCVSRGKTTMEVGRFRYFNARNNCSPPESWGVRKSASPSTNNTGV